MSAHPQVFAPRDLPDGAVLQAFDVRVDEARRRFRDSARRAMAQPWEIRIGTGPATIGFARLGPANAARVLVVLSGVHGIEAVCGSAVQVTVMQRYERALPMGVAVLLVHIVNPFGMDHASRSNAGNVDLNRNWVPDHAALAKVSRTDRIVGRLFSHPVLARLPRPAWIAVLLAHILASRGTGVVKRALAGGQFFDPDAPFYGGGGPAPEADALRAALAEALAGRPAGHLAFLDLHSGIGRFGETCLLGNGGDTARAAALFGAAVSEGHNGPEAVYPVRGDLIRGLKEHLGVRDAAAATFECGTGSALATLLALRDANAARLTGRSARSARRMIRAFCPEDPRWRLGYVRTAHRHIDHALRGLSEEATDV